VIGDNIEVPTEGPQPWMLIAEAARGETRVPPVVFVLENSHGRDAHDTFSKLSIPKPEIPMKSQTRMKNDELIALSPTSALFSLPPFGFRSCGFHSGFGFQIFSLS